MKENESDQFTRKNILLVNHTSNKWVQGLREFDGIPTKRHKYHKILKKESRGIWFQSWEYKSSVWFSLFWKAGSFQVLWEVGCLTASQPQTLGLIRVFCWVSVHSYTVFLSNWLIYEFTKTSLSSSLIKARSKVEAADIISIVLYVPAFLFISS